MSEDDDSSPFLLICRHYSRHRNISIMKETSFFTSSEAEIKQEDSTDTAFVASGGTSICYKMMYYDKLYFKKQLLKELQNDKRYQQAFLKEFEIGQKIDNPYIARYYDISSDANGTFLRIEYVDGVTLTSYVKNNPDYFTHRNNRRAFIFELLSAVSCLHQHRVLHLDLKPDNVMITTIGHHVKLIDLGFCYQDSYPFSLGASDNYCAPEQRSGNIKALSVVTDIFAIGKIFEEYHLCKGQIISKCLKENPKERYQSVEELQRDINSRTGLFIKMAAAVLVIAAIMTGIFVLNPTSTPQHKPIYNKEKKTITVMAPTKPVDVTVAKDTLNKKVPETAKPKENTPETNIEAAPTDLQSDDEYTIYQEPRILPPLHGTPDEKGLAEPDNKGNYYIVTDRTTISNLRQNLSKDEVERMEGEYYSGAQLQFYKARMSRYFSPVNVFLKACKKDKTKKSAAEYWRQYHSAYQAAMGKARRDKKCKPFINSKSGQYASFNEELLGGLNKRAKELINSI